MLRESLIRLLVAYLLLALLFLVYGDSLGRSLIPIFHWELQWIAPEFDISALEPIVTNGALRARLQVSPIGPLVFGEQILYADNPIWPMVVTTPLAQTYQCPLIMVSAALAWPVDSIRKRIVLTVITFPLMLVLAMLDIPLILLGTVWAGLFDTFAPGFNTLVAEGPAWISDGGRLAMCAVAVCIALALCKLLARETGGKYC